VSRFLEQIFVGEVEGVRDGHCGSGRDVGLNSSDLAVEADVRQPFAIGVGDVEAIEGGGAESCFCGRGSLVGDADGDEDGIAEADDWFCGGDFGGEGGCWILGGDGEGGGREKRCD